MSFYSTLDKASFEPLASDPSSPGNGRVYLNTTSGPKWYYGGLWRTALDQGSSQSMSNKTSTNLRLSDYAEFAETSAPTSPSAGYSRLYFKTDGLPYYKNSAGVETQVGSGASSGSGEINVLANPNAATNTASWSSGTSHTITRVTSSSPLDPTIATAFRVEASAAGTESSTSGMYQSFTLPVGLENTKLKISAYITTPTTDAWKVSIYDGTTRLPLSSDVSGSTTLPAGFTGKFQVAFDTTSNNTYTLSFTKTSHTASTEYLYLTSIIVGPGIQPQGAVVSDWISYTPTISSNWGTTSNVTGFYRRVGSAVELNVKFTSGLSTGSAVCSISLPSGLTIDTSKVEAITATTGTVGYVIGSWSSRNAASGAGSMGAMLAGTNTSTSLVYFGGGVASTSNQSNEFTAPTEFSNSIEIQASVVVPISEWAGSGIVNLAQADSQELVIAYNSSTDSGQALSTFNTVQFDTEIVDTASRFASNTFTAVNAGYYDIAATIHLISGTSFARVVVSIFVNGSEVIRCIDDPTAKGAGADVHYTLSQVVSLAQGDQVTIRVNASGTGTYSISGGSTDTRVAIRRISIDGQVIGYGAATATQSGFISREDSGTFTANFTGPFSKSVSIRYRRFGKLVTLDIPEVTDTSSVATYLIASGAIPAEIRPALSVHYVPIFVRNNSADVAAPGYLTVHSNGDISVRKSFTDDNFTNTGTVGGPRGSIAVSYAID